MSKNARDLLESSRNFCLLLTLVVVAIYGRTVAFGFLSYDDYFHVTNNALLNAGELSSLLARFSDRDEQGIVYGLSNGLGSLARVFGPIVAGLTYPYFSNAGPFITAGALTALGAVWTAMLWKRSRTMETPAHA